MEASDNQNLRLIGFRWRKPRGERWFYVEGRAPDSYELREFEIETTYSAPTVGQHQPTAPGSEHPIDSEGGHCD
jgi:hypothetical protein